MIFKRFRLLPYAIIFSLCSAFASAQDARFPAILIKGADISLIECEVTRVLDDGTVSFKPISDDGLEQGVVYAVLVNKREITRIQVTEEKAKGSLAKPVPGHRSLKAIPKGTKVMLKAVKGGGADKYVPLRMDELTIDVKVVANLAANDANKKRIADAGALPLLVRVVMEPSDAFRDDAMFWGATGLWNLAFDEAIKEAIKRRRDGALSCLCHLLVLFKCLIEIGLHLRLRFSQIPEPVLRRLGDGLGAHRSSSLKELARLGLVAPDIFWCAAISHW